MPLVAVPDAEDEPEVDALYKAVVARRTVVRGKIIAAQQIAHQADWRGHVAVPMNATSVSGSSRSGTRACRVPPYGVSDGQFGITSSATAALAGETTFSRTRLPWAETRDRPYVR